MNILKENGRILTNNGNALRATEIESITDVLVNNSSVVTGNIAYVTVPTELQDLIDDSTHRVVTDIEKAAWNNKVDRNILDTKADLVNGKVPNAQLPDDAPSDDKQYARQNGEWTEVNSSKIDVIKVNDVPQTITNKTVNISVPTNYVTTDTTQTITGEKTFNNTVVLLDSNFYIDDTELSTLYERLFGAGV